MYTFEEKMGSEGNWMVEMIVEELTVEAGG